MKKTFFALLFAFFSTAANGYTGADLLAQCKKFVQIIDGAQPELQQTLDAGLCGGYVLGVQDGFVASTDLTDIASKEKGITSVAKHYWDVPAETESEKIVQIVVRYLELHPDMHKEPAVLSVINALRQTYPAD